MTSRALVLGGGGVAGIAWLTGLFAGFADSGFDPLDADLILATSAGAGAGAQLTSGVDLETLYACQADPARQVEEPEPDPAALARAAAARPGLLAAGEREAVTRARGLFALSAETVAPAVRRAVVAARLPSHTWPPHPFKLVAVDALSGETALFDRQSEVSLIDAVAASSAVPGVWPPVMINGRPYIDGGARSTESLDLATGYDRVLALVPVGADFKGTPPRDLAADVAALEAQGARVFVVEPDATSQAAIIDRLLDPMTRGPAAKAGRAQGRAIGAAAIAFWRDA